MIIAQAALIVVKTKSQKISITNFKSIVIRTLEELECLSIQISQDSKKMSLEKQKEMIKHDFMQSTKLLPDDSSALRTQDSTESTLKNLYQEFWGFWIR